MFSGGVPTTGVRGLGRTRRGGWAGLSLCVSVGRDTWSWRVSTVPRRLRGSLSRNTGHRGFPKQ